MIDLEQFVFPLLTPSLLQILMSSDDILTLILLILCATSFAFSTFSVKVCWRF